MPLASDLGSHIPCTPNPMTVSLCKHQVATISVKEISHGIASIQSRSTTGQDVDAVGPNTQYSGEIVGCEVRMIARLTTETIVVMGSDPLNLAMNVVVSEVLEPV